MKGTQEGKSEGCVMWLCGYFHCVSCLLLMMMTRARDDEQHDQQHIHLDGCDGDLLLSFSSRVYHPSGLNPFCLMDRRGCFSFDGLPFFLSLCNRCSSSLSHVLSMLFFLVFFSCAKWQRNPKGKEITHTQTHVLSVFLCQSVQVLSLSTEFCG